MTINKTKLLENIQAVQRRDNLVQSQAWVTSKIATVNLDVEMETGTGKTYCYIKTFFEMNKRFGWSKFIVVVPSIAIREGVFKTLAMTADHFLETYQKKARFFIYNSKQLHNIESFSSDSGINIMVINVQAFASRSRANRRIYEALDDFQSRCPIDVIKANRPILVLDEPQKMEGKKTLSSLEEFNSLMILRYSATHKTTHNKVHRLDALDAYNQKLVKKINVRGISVKGLSGINAYFYLSDIQISKKNPLARIEYEVKMKTGSIKRVTILMGKGDNLFDLSNELDQYKGFIISEINANTDVVSFLNGEQLVAGDAAGDVDEITLRRIQIREAVRVHLAKEQMLFSQGIKVLTLFFIDEVARYRQYDDNGMETGGEYARIFEEEYQVCLREVKPLLSLDHHKYLGGINVEDTHKGYFAIDKKTKRLVDPRMNKTEMKKGEANDADAYDLILKDKERLLSFAEPTRFIFSHSALREGWDNPNVFVICTLKHSDNSISRRQEVGRGLRIAVNEAGERQDDPATVHQTNILTVVANESYNDFVAGLQKDISEALSARPRFASVAYFTGKELKTESGDKIEVTAEMAESIKDFLVRNNYVDSKNRIVQDYQNAVKDGSIASLSDDLQPYSKQIFNLINSVYDGSQMPDYENDRNPKDNPLNDNFNKKEFKKLWNKINKKASYTVHFDSRELIAKCVQALNRLEVKEMQYIIKTGEQHDSITQDEIEQGDAFEVTATRTEKNSHSLHSAVKYDLIGKIAESVQLTRKTVAEILCTIDKTVFYKFKINPEDFIAQATRLIKEQKATVIIEHLTYDTLTSKFGSEIFTNPVKANLSKAGEPLKHHIYDYAITDSKVERKFVKDLDTSSEVAVYAKLPKGFYIPTPVGDYNPDWAIAFQEGSVKHVYFVAETKGSMSSMELREIEQVKIQCARKFFATVNQENLPEKVRYDVVDSYDKLMDIVGVATTTN